MSDWELLKEAISERLRREAKEVFDPETATDSDGLDQAEAQGILRALEIIEREF